MPFQSKSSNERKLLKEPRERKKKKQFLDGWCIYANGGLILEPEPEIITATESALILASMWLLECTSLL